MEEKTKELIAIGASIGAHCQPCLRYHIEQALKLGVTIEEIQEAISVGKLVEKGAFKAMDNFAKEQLEVLNQDGGKSFKADKADGCCCSNDSGCCS